MWRCAPLNLCHKKNTPRLKPNAFTQGPVAAVGTQIRSATFMGISSICVE